MLGKETLLFVRYSSFTLQKTRLRFKSDGRLYGEHCWLFFFKLFKIKILKWFKYNFEEIYNKCQSFNDRVTGIFAENNGGTHELEKYFLALSTSDLTFIFTNFLSYICNHESSLCKASFDLFSLRSA